tara:strand:- start:157117 stop:158382 length:1266 start_codon:yes stop_codon:yes gene_type:complete
MALDRSNIDLLRFSVIGSVDDGKSTLIGRLLYDSKSIFEDQLQAIEESSKKRGDERVNLALLTDGLKAEREQGITIDVAYRYFATPKRKFIIADCPGHIQYTRNMVTGTSNVNLATVLVDARHGVVEQTKRHTFIASLMGVKHIVLCVNKMDLVEFSEERYEEIKAEYLSFISKMDIPDVHIIPISALDGDNILESSEKMPWYKGNSYLYTLENVHLGSDFNMVDCRFPIQRVIRPQSDKFHDFRGFAGRVEGGVFKPGDEVSLLPSGFKTKIKNIETLDAPTVEEAFHPMSVVMTLEDEFDLSRGDMIVKEKNQPAVTQDLDLMICWFTNDALKPRGKYVMKHTTRDVRVMVKEVQYKVDIHTLHRAEDDSNIGLNDIGKITVRASKPVFTDLYKNNKGTGLVILIDEFSNETVACGMVV